MTDLLDALYRGDDERVSQLLADGPELNVFEAAALGHTDRLRELLDEDPSRANAFGDDGFQPLGLACFFGHLEHRAQSEDCYVASVFHHLGLADFEEFRFGFDFCACS